MQLLRSSRFLASCCPPSGARLQRPLSTMAEKNVAASAQTMLYSASMDVYQVDALKAVSPSAERNKQPILDALRPRLPAAGLLLEVASGSGQHAAHLAAALPGLVFQPSDQTDELFQSIAAYGHGLANVLPPLLLDASAPDSWQLDGSAAALAVVLCCNMVHISPWSASQGLLEGAGGLVCVYGPFMVDGQQTSESNAAFDASLRSRDSRWGIRDVAVVQAEAERHGLVLLEVVQMPANNLLLVFSKEGVP